MKILNKKQSGFTLVELVVVVAVIGVLAVIAAPKIIGVASDARQASLSAVASSFTAAMARNYAASEASSGTSEKVDNCKDIESLLDGDVLPSGYKFIDASSNVDVSVGKQETCYIFTESNPVLPAMYFSIGTDM
jgi:prepilin-type N-terminal cleavage/methylation domain-containing protein